MEVSKMKMLICGDTHGLVDRYWKMLQKHPNHNSIQVGDFGFKKEHEWHLKNIDSAKHKINFGNHDDTSFLYRTHSLGDWSYTNGIMTVRGAYSIDKDHRIEGKSWWANEELSYQKMQAVIDAYILNKPRIMITHCAPNSIQHTFFGIWEKSMTTNGLQAMFEAHQPELWIFGHYHRSVNEIINGTRFRCLAELETMEL